MTTVELNDEEMSAVRAAVAAYLEELGHEEQGRINLVQRVYRKLGGDPSTLDDR